MKLPTLSIHLPLLSWRLIGWLLMSWLLLAATTAQADIASGKMLAQTCAACHGTDGREFNDAMPPLAGMNAAKFSQAMRAFQDGSRSAIIMDRVARGYNDAEIAAMATFFANVPASQYSAQRVLAGE